jgi:hypothetical protein
VADDVVKAYIEQQWPGDGSFKVEWEKTEASRRH